MVPYLPTKPVPPIEPGATAVDLAMRRLKCSGWSVGDLQTDSEWVVTCFMPSGENRIVARGRTQLAAWQEAMRQAEAIGLLGRSFW